MARDRGTPGDLRDAAERLLRRLDRSGRLQEARAADVWAEAAGPHVAAHTRATGVREGVLLVDVDSNAWATELTAMAPQFAEAVNRVAGKTLVKGVRFTVTRSVVVDLRAGREADAAASAARDGVEPSELDPAETAFVQESVAGIEDDGLRAAARRAMTADLAWKKGVARERGPDARTGSGEPPGTA